jgi:hypothetical protein
LILMFDSMFEVWTLFIAYNSEMLVSMFGCLNI